MTPKYLPECMLHAWLASAKNVNHVKRGKCKNTIKKTFCPGIVSVWPLPKVLKGEIARQHPRAVAVFVLAIFFLFKVSRACTRIIRMGRFRIPKTLAFKRRLSAKSFLWKWVLFCMGIKIIIISMASHLASLSNRGLGQPENGLFNSHSFPELIIKLRVICCLVFWKNSFSSTFFAFVYYHSNGSVIFYFQ